MLRPVTRLLRPDSSARLRIAAALSLMLFCPMMAGRALALEPRPWLCRDKPAISSPGATQLVVTRHDRRAWQFFLLQLSPTPGSGHDGFTVVRGFSLVAERNISTTLGRGQFFAVPLYRGTGGHWICPGEVDDNTRPGEISHICYSANRDGACDISLSANRTRS